ncbi:unnamed protein product [Strongylus vulgaris]|uniref:alpha-1,2-Mannosidase n=1 Tax=Strongylus vulgaris TaxID=40348 RepID=A0A3P7JF54_STRVU|nr:unnamed protein product [Strongylus vulgaris]
MQTVRLNRAAVAASAAVMFILLCVISYLPSTPANLQLIRAIRPEPDLLKGNKIVEEDTTAHLRITTRAQRVTASSEDNDYETEFRRKKVVEMMQHAWSGYKNYSWGENELRPVSKSFNKQDIFGGREMPATIVDAADTLFIMGLKEEYEEARDYIEKNFDMSKATGTLSVFETNIRFLGGLLSLYALTKEEFYISKARSVGEALLPAFKTPSGIPKSNLNMKTKLASNYHWANGG